MVLDRRVAFGTAFLAALPLCALMLAVGCSKSQDTAGGAPTAGPSASPGGPGGMPGGMRGGGPGGPGGRMGGRFGPVAATATGAEIYQQKCQGCHGAQGQGARGPSLAQAAGRPQADLVKIIRDGHNRMPAFASQLTPAQITKVAGYVKQLKPRT